MQTAVPVKRIWSYLIPVWLLIGLTTHISAILWMIQYGEDLSLYRIFDVGFYYYTPVILWILYTPILIRLYIKRPLSGSDWKRNLLFHFLLSAAFAPLARILAIALDFSIKNLIGMESTPAWEIVYQARFIAGGSAYRAFLSYWGVIGAIIAWEYFAFRKEATAEKPPQKRNKKQIAAPYKSGKKIIDVQDILWIEANGNYVNIYTSEHCFKLRRSLASLTNDLDERQFLQIHRSKIINKAAIESLSHWRRGEYLIRLKNNKLLSSSRTYRQNLQEILAG